MNNIAEAVAVSELTAPFWEAASNRSLVYPYCPQCAQAFFVPQVVCPTCHTYDWEWRTSGGVGVVETFTWIERPPTPEFDPPYCLAVVVMEEGWRLLTNIVKSEPGKVTIGDRVAVEWIERGGQTLPGFAPTGGAR